MEHLRQTAENYLSGQHRNLELSQNINSSALSRLTWFVGLGGFALINAQSFWDKFTTSEPSIDTIIYLSLPLILAMIIGVISHFFIDESQVVDIKVYTKKVTQIELFIVSLNGMDPIADLPSATAEFLDIVNDRDEEINKLIDKSNKYLKWVRLLERSTFLLLVLGFIWAFIGVLIL